MFFTDMMVKLLEKTWLILLSANLLALIYPNLGKYVEPYLTVILVMLMTFSTRNIDFGKVFSKKAMKKGFVMMLANYLILTPIILISALFVDKAYFPGFIIMAAVPCAIAVIPYTKLLKGNSQCSTSGLIINYLFSLILAPLITYFFFAQSVSIYKLIETLVLLVILPLLLSRLFKPINKKLDKYDTKIINTIFFVLAYGFVSLNRDTIVFNIASLKIVMLLLFIRTILITQVMRYLTRKKGRFGISLTLFAGYKNLGLAALLALTLFNKEASLPATLALLFENIAFILLTRTTSASHI